MSWSAFRADIPAILAKEEYQERLVHPCQSVWCCAFLPNGDIVSAGSDKAIRIWTASSDRVADLNVLEVSRSVEGPRQYVNVRWPFTGIREGDCKHQCQVRRLPASSAIVSKLEADADPEGTRFDQRGTKRLWSISSWTMRSHLYSFDFPATVSPKPDLGECAFELIWSSKADPEELATSFAEKHQLTTEEKEQIESFVRGAQGHRSP